MPSKQSHAVLKLSRIIAYCICIGFWPSSSLANSVERIVSLIKAQPEYLEALSRVSLSDWNIANILARGKPTLSFSSAGKYPLASSAQATSRSNSGDRYVDGLLTFKFPLTDFGEREKRAEAERFRKQSSILSLTLTEERILFEIIESALLIQKNKALGDGLAEDIEAIEEQKEIEKIRYRAGTGTLSIVRELELMALELKTQLRLASLELNLLRSSFRDRFNANVEEFIDAALNISNMPLLERIENPKPSTLKIFDLDGQEIDKKIEAVRLSSYPKVDLTVTGAFYNVTKKAISDREAYGGIGVSFPLYDAGLKDAEINSLQVERKMIFARRDKKGSSIKLEYMEIYSLLDRNEQKIIDNRGIIENLKANLDELKIKSQSISANAFEETKIASEIKSIDRETQSIEWENKILRLKLAMLDETLLQSLQSELYASR